ncbi:MAG: hypothetical protein J0L75_05005 [Spirochaetes bacterium]|nr:hypothetical protein [Spirochaetota bacterium]
MDPWKFVTHDQFPAIGHNLKLKVCPFFRRVGTLSLHGYLRGQDEKHHPSVRARRIFCSDRTRRPGCGRTFSLFLSHCLVGLKVGTAVAWAFLSGILAGLSIEKAVYAVAAQHDLSLSTFWRLWQKLKGAQAAIRTVLSRECSPTSGPLRPP